MVSVGYAGGAATFRIDIVDSCWHPAGLLRSRTESTVWMCEYLQRIVRPRRLHALQLRGVGGLLSRFCNRAAFKKSQWNWPYNVLRANCTGRGQTSPHFRLTHGGRSAHTVSINEVVNDGGGVKITNSSSLIRSRGALSLVPISGCNCSTRARPRPGSRRTRM